MFDVQASGAIDKNKVLKTVVFSGGGSRGIAHAGFLRALYEKQAIDWGLRCPRLECVAGCSIGAFTAFCIVIGYSVAEFEDLASTVTFADLTNISPMRIFQQRVALDDSQTLRTFLRKIMSSKIRCDEHECDTVTFQDLFERTKIHFACSATCIEERSLVLFSSSTSPSVCVLDALLASMALPPVFDPVKIDGRWYADGGLVNGLPISFFDSSTTLGIRLVQQQLTMKDIFASKLPIASYLLQISRIGNYQEDFTGYTVVFIDCKKLSAFDTPSEKGRKDLLLSGYDSAVLFLSTFPSFFQVL